MSNGGHTFGTTINCMDGRAIQATHEWMREHFPIEYIDSITEPGMDGWLTHMDTDARTWLKRKIEISTKGHGSRVVAVVGHDECAGNPVSEDEHRHEIEDDTAVVRSILDELELPDVEIVPLWVHEVSGKWVADKI